MSVIAKAPESTFTPAPEGLHHAVCVDVIDLGLKDTTWGEKHKVRLVWQIEEENEDTGRRFEVRKQYNLSLHEKATLRKDLEAWRSRKFTDVELQGFDLEKLIGANCQVQVSNDLTDDGRTFANVQAVVPAPKNVAKLIAQNYTRHQDQPKQQGNAADKKEDSDVPF